MADEAGFESLWISDHFHPWNDEQGQSPFVWSIIGAIAQVCDAAHHHGGDLPDDPHPPRDRRARRGHERRADPGPLRRSASVGRGAQRARHRRALARRRGAAGHARGGRRRHAQAVARRLRRPSRRHYTVENARLYTLPDEPPPVYVSGFGPSAAALAGRIGDGFVTTSPDKDMIARVPRRRRRGQAGTCRLQGLLGQRRRPVRRHRAPAVGQQRAAGRAVPDPAQPEALRAGERARHQAVHADSIAYGDDVDRHVEAFRPFADAGVDVVHISQMGGRYGETNAAGFFEFYRDEVLPRLREIG